MIKIIYLLYIIFITPLILYSGYLGRKLFKKFEDTPPASTDSSGDSSGDAEGDAEGDADGDAEGDADGETSSDPPTASNDDETKYELVFNILIVTGFVIFFYNVFMLIR